MFTNEVLKLLGAAKPETRPACLAAARAALAKIQKSTFRNRLYTRYVRDPGDGMYALNGKYAACGARRAVGVAMFDMVEHELLVGGAACFTPVNVKQRRREVIQTMCLLPGYTKDVREEVDGILDVMAARSNVARRDRWNRHLGRLSAVMNAVAIPLRLAVALSLNKTPWNSSCFTFEDVEGPFLDANEAPMYPWSELTVEYRGKLVFPVLARPAICDAIRQALRHHSTAEPVHIDLPEALQTNHTANAAYIGDLIDAACKLPNRQQTDKQTHEAPPPAEPHPATA